MGLSENLKAIRKKRNISQRTLASESGVSYSMVSKLESGEQKNPSLETLEKIAKALDVTPSQLMDGMNIYDRFNIVMGDTLAELQKDIQSAKNTIPVKLHELLISEQATEFFEINQSAISPDDFENIESLIIDYIRYQFSKYKGQKSIYYKDDK